jgi:hypothetical protein
MQQRTEYDEWRQEVYTHLEHANVYRRLYQKKAHQYKWYDAVTKLVVLLGSSGAVYAALREQDPHLLGLLAFGVAIAGVLSVVFNWATKSERWNLAAQQQGRLEAQWYRLWMRIDNYRYDDLSEIIHEIEHLLDEGNRIGSMVVPTGQHTNLLGKLQYEYRVSHPTESQPQEVTKTEEEALPEGRRRYGESTTTTTPASSPETGPE